jgi:hypothetical protein
MTNESILPIDFITAVSGARNLGVPTSAMTWPRLKFHIFVAGAPMDHYADVFYESSPQEDPVDRCRDAHHSKSFR